MHFRLKYSWKFNEKDYVKNKINSELKSYVSGDTYKKLKKNGIPIQDDNKMNKIIKAKIIEKLKFYEEKKIKVIEEGDPEWFIKFNNYAFKKIDKYSAEGILYFKWLNRTWI